MLNTQRLASWPIQCDDARAATSSRGVTPLIFQLKNNVLTIFLALIISILPACGSVLTTSHPLVQKDKNAAHALVYFIRPRPERTMAMADNVIDIELDKRPFLSLAKGEYTYSRLIPGQVWITINSRTTAGPEHRIKDMSKTASFTFVAGQTYYLAIQPVDGEFRGVHFEARTVDHTTALELSKRARPKSGLFAAKLK